MMNTQPVSVIIVESQAIMRSALSSTLSAEGMTVLAEVADSRQVVQTASKLTPDLILFSVASPSLDDLQRISVLRQEVPTASILALITGEFSGQEQAALDYGAHMVLTRLTSRSELVKALKWLMEIQPAVVNQINI